MEPHVWHDFRLYNRRAEKNVGTSCFNHKKSALTQPKTAENEHWKDTEKDTIAMPPVVIEGSAPQAGAASRKTSRGRGRKKMGGTRTARTT